MSAAGPVSRILSAGKLPLAGDHVPQDGHSSRPRIATRLKRPTRRFGAPSQHAPCPELALRSQASSLFGLAPCGVCHARSITGTAVRSYRTFSPLPDVAARAVYFLWHFPSADLKVGFPDVIRHTALWSSDFPPSSLDAARATVRSSCLRFDYIRCLLPQELAAFKVANFSDEHGRGRPRRQTQYVKARASSPVL